MKKVLFALTVIVLGVLLSLGCGGGSASNGPVSSTPAMSNSLVFTVSTTRGAYARGTAVPITFTVANTGTQAANLNIGTCFDYAVQINQGAQQIWTGPSEACAVITRPVTIAAGATQTYSTTWNQMDSQGNAVPASTYTFRASLTPLTLNGTVLSTTQLATFVSNPISITITP